MKRKRKASVPLAKVPMLAIAVPGYCAICGMESEETHPSCAEWLGPYYIPSKAAMDLSTLRYSGATMDEALENLESAIAGPYRVYNTTPGNPDIGSLRRSMDRMEVRTKQQEAYLQEIELGFRRYYTRGLSPKHSPSIWDTKT